MKRADMIRTAIAGMMAFEERHGKAHVARFPVRKP